MQCVQCHQMFEPGQDRPRLERPSGVRRSELGSRVQFSYRPGHYNLDPRWVLAAVVVGSGLFLPELLSSLGEVPVDPTATHTWSLVGLAVLAVFVTSRLLRRQEVELDGSRLRLSSGPTLFVNDVEQLYVTPRGQLRAVRRTGQHQTLLVGPPASLRYLEQQIEDTFKVVDVPVEGEWKGVATGATQRCPHCGYLGVQKNVSAPVAAATGTRYEVQRSDGVLTISWRWMSWNAGTVGVMGFMTVWLVGWDTGVGAFVAVGLMSALKGNLLGLAVFLLPHVWIGAVLTWFYLATLLNRTTIRVLREKTLTVRSGPLPWPWANKSIPVSQLEQLYVVEGRGCKLEARLRDGRRVQVAGGFTDATSARWLEQQIEGFLGIRDEG